MPIDRLLSIKTDYPVVNPLDRIFTRVMKVGNPYHDPHTGEFTGKGGGSKSTFHEVKALGDKPGQSSWMEVKGLGDHNPGEAKDFAVYHNGKGVGILRTNGQLWSSVHTAGAEPTYSQTGSTTSGEALNKLAEMHDKYLKTTAGASGGYGSKTGEKSAAAASQKAMDATQKANASGKASDHEAATIAHAEAVVAHGRTETGQAASQFHQTLVDFHANRRQAANKK